MIRANLLLLSTDHAILQYLIQMHISEALNEKSAWIDAEYL